jgi:hypothetical protein
MYSGGNISIQGTSTLTGLVTASSGITLGKGITFPDGTHQASAASGSGGGGVSAGAGLTLNGSTLGIDPTAIVHVAGISSDGSIVIPAGNSYGWSDGCFITTASGALQFSANSGYYGVQLSSSTFSVYRDAFFEDGVHVAGAAGISADKGIKLGTGITFPDSTHQTTAVNPTAIVHVAGISADGGITAAGDLNYTGILNAYDGGQIKLRQSGANRLVIQDSTLATLYTTRFHIPSATEVLSGNALYYLAGISMASGGGITFADGTFQSTAAAAAGGTGYIAGAGLALDAAGGTFSIDPTAVIHVAGISSDGGITAGGDVRSNKFVDLSFGNNDGMAINSNNNISFITGNTTRANITSAGILSQAKLEASTFVKASTYVHAGTGISMDAAGITFPDGTFQSTASNNAIQGVTYVAGFLFDGRGVTVAAAKKTDIVRPIEGTATIAELGIRLPEGAGGGTASASVYKVGSNYINTSGLSLAADGITVGTIDLQNGLYGGTASGGGTMANGDLIYCGVTGAGLGKIIQVFVTYEV